MRKIPVKKDKFLKTCVTMLMGLDKLEVNTQVLFLTELVKRMEPEGVLVKGEVKKVIMDEMRLTKYNFDQLLNRLQLGDHLRVSGGIIYLHPKYVAMAQCEGNLLITAE